jgi:hypothetical protein
MIHFSVSERDRAVYCLGIEGPAKHASGDLHGLAELWRVRCRASLRTPRCSPKTSPVAILADTDFSVAMNSNGKERAAIVCRTAEHVYCYCKPG